MEERIVELKKSLAFLGYDGFQIRLMVRDAIGRDGSGRINLNQSAKLVRHLEKYEKLGRNYLRTYSK